MKALLSTTAVATLLAGAVLAQTGAGYVTRAETGDMMGSDLIGARLYAADYEGNPADYDRDWDDIGEINDLIVSNTGEIRGVLVDIGGFLGIGERQVAIQMSELSFLAEDGADDMDDFRIVVDRSREMLEQAPEFETERHASAAGLGTVSDASRNGYTWPTVERAGWESAARDDLTAEDLEGVRVYGLEDEDVGEIADLVVLESGRIQAVIVDVGGFLGLGEHRVALPFEQVNLLRETEGDDIRAYVDATEERLKEMPEYTN